MKVTSGKYLFVSIIFSSVAGLLFIVSGFTKLFPVEYFETIIIERTGFGAEVTSWLARIIIGFEWVLGCLLIIRWRLRKFTTPLAIITLTGFCILMVFQIISAGNDSNCGCFGNVWVMTPAEAIIKNVILIILLVICLFINNRSFTKNFWWFFPVFFIGTALPFVFNPGEIVYPKEVFLKEKEVINLSLLYTDSVNEPPKIDLIAGKHIIAFMSLKCRHCRLAAYKMGVLYNQNPGLPFFYVLNGDPELLGDFWAETNSKEIPHTMFKGPEKFLALSGPDLPAIVMVNNSIIEGRLTYRNINEQCIIRWLE